MKRILLFVVCIIGFCTPSKAQIAPPKQTDTLIITSVKYNYADIDQENWPCGVIYKSTTSFIIGDSEFPIVSVYTHFDEVTFTVTGDDGETQYELVYKEKYSGEIVIKFSGYEFLCCKNKHLLARCSEATAKLAGRTVNGTLPLPSYGVQIYGKVVVDIWVDRYGYVRKALAGAEGTTITNETLWQAARKAALGADFNMSKEAPNIQKGTITYIFK